MRPFILLLFINIICCGRILAQSGSISIYVKSSGNTIDGATVSLLNARDSSWVKSDITDVKGTVTLNGVAVGKYLVSATAMGYTANVQQVEVKDAQTASCHIELQKESTALNEVAITAKKPFLEMSLGKTVVNVDGSTTTGSSNALELMGRLPGVIVDQNGGISMRGKSGVLVLVGDRPTYLTGDDLASFLKGITANEVAQIELITQPGAKYDAAGNTGVINIKLRKNKKQGWNGNAALSYQPGEYFNRSESFLLNYKKNKLSVLLGGSDMEAIGHADWKQDMYYTDEQGNITGSNINHSTATERFAHTALRFAVDYELSEKTTIGVNARAVYHPNKMRSNIVANYRDDINNLTTYTSTDATEGHIRKEVMTNAYITHKFSKDHTLDVNVDYLFFARNMDQDFTTITYNDQGQPASAPFRLNKFQVSPINIYSVKVDDACTFKNGLKLEAGIKTSQVAMDFDAHFHLLENNTWINDTGRTNRFLYKESVNAGYITLGKTLGEKWEARLGLRAEQTSVSGMQYVHNVGFTKNYASLFPTVFVSYKSDTDNQFEVSYGRRIDRPEYRQLNPFIYYSFQNMYSVGNPDLMPQYTNNMELKHSYKNTVITTLSWSGTTDVVQGFLTVDSAKVSYNKLVNIASNNNISLDVDFNKDIFKWWSLNVSGNVFYAAFEGMFNNALKKAEWTGYSVNTNSRFDLGKGWKSELYARYVSAGRWSLTSTFDPMIVFDCGASKKIGDHWTARFFAQDPFGLFSLKAHDYGTNYLSATEFRNATRRYTFSVTYTFGNSQNSKGERSIDEAKRL